MKKLYILLFACIGFALPGRAQQKPHYGQYMLNSYLFNPSLTGIENYTDARMSYRNQWTSMEGAPVSMYLSAHGPLNKRDRSSSILSLPAQGQNQIINKIRYKKENDFAQLSSHHGLGGTIFMDKIGMEKRFGMTASYAYHLPVQRNMKLSSGISAGFTRYSMDMDKLDFGPHADPVIGQYQKALLLPELSLGTTLYGKNFYIGAAVTQLLQDHINKYSLSGNKQKRFVNHYYLTGGIERRLTPEIAVTPSVLVKKTDASPVFIDLNLRVSYLRQAWCGVSYRHQNAVAALVGYNFNTFMTVGYAYEAVSSNISQYSSGTHELMLGFVLSNSYRTVNPGEYK
ncbi:PorP/SprF family type IX secretion system membrane protein [Botryobacter ruber]|uniref:PorP/SprF family type IX secretion system membrane protein n=1 Tax=Botryobacter ruber TaxID=2171629 RepID=UPI000E0BF243|nr:type IX secretion system membrane protein PorP/SprF [Botryobacter ruber]